MATKEAIARKRHHIVKPKQVEDGKSDEKEARGCDFMEDSP